MVDYLESLERLAMPDELHIKECEKLGIGVTEDFDIVEQALLELKAIKEANPSEALECLEKVYSRLPQWDLSRNVDQCNIIKQALQRLGSIEYALKICKKANEQKYVYIKESYGISKEKFLDDLDYEVLNNRLYASSRGMYYDFPLKDYGNWWALTKEELKNE